MNRGYTTIKTAFVLLLILLAAQWLPAQQPGQVSWTPLLLFTNGSGTVSPYQNGQMLQVGNKYVLTASPASDSEFRNWQQVSVLTEVKRIDYPSGVTVITTNATVINAGGRYDGPHLTFIAQPAIVQVLDAHPGTLTVTLTRGWQANFKPRVRSGLPGDISR